MLSLCSLHTWVSTSQSSPFHFRHWPRPQGIPRGYLRQCGLPTYGGVESLTKGAQSSELAKKVFRGGAGPSALILQRLLPGRERAPHRQSLGKPRPGSPGARRPQPLSPSRPAATLGGEAVGAWEGTARHWLARGTERRDQRGPPDSGKPRPRRTPRAVPPGPALPCPAPRGRRDVRLPRAQASPGSPAPRSAGASMR